MSLPKWKNEWRNGCHYFPPLPFIPRKLLKQTDDDWLLHYFPILNALTNPSNAAVLLTDCDEFIGRTEEKAKFEKSMGRMEMTWQLLQDVQCYWLAEDNTRGRIRAWNHSGANKRVGREQFGRYFGSINGAMKGKEKSRMNRRRKERENEKRQDQCTEDG